MSAKTNPLPLTPEDFQKEQTKYAQAPRVDAAHKPKSNVKGLRKPKKKPKQALSLPPKLLEKMPETFRLYMEYASPLTDAPDEFLLMPFMAIAGAHVGQKRYIEFGKGRIYPAVWTVIFAGSSTMRKSTSQSIAKHPFKSVIDRWRDEYRVELAAWETARLQAEANNETFTDPEPQQRHLIAPDGFSDLVFFRDLAYNGNMISLASEFTGLWQEINKSRNGLYDTFMNLFDAPDSERRKTVSGGEVELQYPVLGIAGATTLSNFKKNLSENERESGFLQRIIPVVMTKSPKGYIPITRLPEPNYGLLADLSERMLSILSLSTERVYIDDDAEKKHAAWAEENNTHATDMESSISGIGGYASRLETYALKYALIFQTYDDPGRPITLSNMEAAILLAEWNLEHIKQMLTDEYIFDRSYADRLKVREVIRAAGNIIDRTLLSRATRMSARRMDEAISNDEAAGFIKVTELKADTSRKGGRSKRVYELVEKGP